VLWIKNLPGKALKENKYYLEELEQKPKSASKNPPKSLSLPPKHAKIPGMDKVIEFVNQSMDELKRIQWPSKKETIRLTGYVIGVSLGVGLFVMLFDYLFAQGLTLMIGK
jgi:preprotein translocase SecE subunit